MGDETKYEYRAVRMDKDSWMVQRYEVGIRPAWNIYTESLMQGDFADGASAIEAAKERGSWA